MIFISLFIILCSGLLSADTITVFNTTESDLYVAVYYVASKADRSTPIFYLKPRSYKTLDRPERKLLYDRQLALSVDPGMFEHSLEKKKFDALSSVNIGNLKGTTFYVISERNRFKGMTEAEYIKVNGTILSIDEATKRIIEQYEARNPHAHTQARVRTGTALAPEEISYLSKRQKLVKKALSELLGHELADRQVPRIALCASGGGYRAYSALYGSLKGAAQSGILPVCTYIAGLSGSSWMLATWFQKGGSIEAFESTVYESLQKNLLKAPIDITQFTEHLKMKIMYKQPITSIDLYGALLSTIFLGSAYPAGADFASQAQRLSSGSWPLPIHTAIMTKEPYEWIEFTPYEVGSDYLGGYIPTWSFGRAFANGSSRDMAPSQSVGFFMGIWGSAYTANMYEAFRAYEDRIPVKQIRDLLERMFRESPIGRMRVSPAQVNNFMYGITVSPRGTDSLLTLVDGGVDFNFPIAPLLRQKRAVDIIIVLDCGVYGSQSELSKMHTYCVRKGYSIPLVSVNELSGEPCKVFKPAAGSSEPIIIYIPFHSNSNFGAFDPIDCIYKHCATLTLQYSSSLIRSIIGLTSANMMQSSEIITHVLQEWVDSRL